MTSVNIPASGARPLLKPSLFGRPLSEQPFRSTQIGKGFFGACGISLDRGLMDLIPPRFGQA